MSNANDDQARLGALIDDRDGVVVLALAALLAGLAVGWAARSLLAGEPVSEQFWLLPVVLSLAVALYAQAREGTA